MAGEFLRLIVFGVGLTLLGWFANERMPNRNGAGEWRSAPRPLWRFFRRGPGPPLVPAIALEGVGVIWVCLGLLGMAGVRSQFGPMLTAGPWVLLGITWIVVELRGRLRD